MGAGAGVVGSSHTEPLTGFGKKRRDGTISVSSCLRRTKDQNGTEQHRTLPKCCEGRKVGGVGEEAGPSALSSD